MCPAQRRQGARSCDRAMVLQRGVRKTDAASDAVIMPLKSDEEKTSLLDPRSECCFDVTPQAVQSHYEVWLQRP